MKKKIIFIEPRGVESNVFSAFMTLPLLGPVYMATMLKKRGHDVKIINENILGREIKDNELSADILCLTGLTSTINRTYDLAERFRQLNPFSKIIIGGIHASFQKEEAGAFADHVVVGEGEQVIIDLIEKGSSEKYVYSPGMTDLNQLPIPDFDLIQNNKKMWVAPIMTSRGCPFACNFCAVTAMYGRGYRTRSNDLVMQELRKVKRKAFFYDDNLCVNHKRSYELFDQMKKEKLGIRWSAQVRCDAAKDDLLLRKMADSGCVKVYIGFESVNQKALDALHKSQSVENIKTAIKKFHDNGIKVHGMFMLGADEDDKNTFTKTSSFVNEHEIDTVQYMTLTPIPGTPLFNDFESKGRLLHKKWQHYDGMHAVFSPKNFSALELQEGVIDCYKDFYKYTKAIGDSIDLLHDVVASSLLRLRNRYKTNLPSTLLGKYIINKWLRTNGSYMHYLKNTHF
jgi:radical SAM superfamily enzyme YgiQ (UPF0313 family)